MDDILGNGNLSNIDIFKFRFREKVEQKLQHKRYSILVFHRCSFQCNLDSALLSAHIGPFRQNYSRKDRGHNICFPDGNHEFGVDRDPARNGHLNKQAICGGQ